MWRVPGGAVEEVELPQPSLLLLDDRQALARDDEEVLLSALGVVHAGRLARLEHGERVADLGEHLRLEALASRRDAAVGLELAAEAEGVVRDQAASRALTTNQPAVTGARPFPTCSRRASSVTLGTIPSSYDELQSQAGEAPSGGAVP